MTFTVSILLGLAIMVIGGFLSSRKKFDARKDVLPER